jgi:hypothetical protein
MTTPNPYDRTPWRALQVDRRVAERALERLGHAGYIASALGILATDLRPGTSLTVRQLPINLTSGNLPDTLARAATDISEIIHREGINDLGAPFQLGRNVLPEEMGEPALPQGVNAGLDPEQLVGYVRVEHMDGRVQSSVGALDPLTQTRHFLPLPVYLG